MAGEDEPDQESREKPVEKLAQGDVDDMPIDSIGGTKALNVGVPREMDDAFDQGTLESCPHCTRTFRPESLAIHLRSCKADKPLKKRMSTREEHQGGKTGQNQRPLPRQRHGLEQPEESQGSAAGLNSNVKRSQKSSQPK